MGIQVSGIIDSDNDPVNYPWEAPKAAGVLLEYRPESDELDAQPKVSFIPMRLDRKRKASAATVELNCGDNTAQIMSIEKAADEMGHASIGSRFLVVAVGSNANLEVLGNKFSRRLNRKNLFIPFAPAVVTNLSVGYFADISERGYIAATAFHKQDAKSLVWVAWLDEDELEALDSTEPGYSRRLVNACDYPLEILSEVPDGNGTIRDLPENTSYSDLVAEKPENYFIYDADSGFIGKDVDTPLLNKQSDIFEWLSGINSELEFLFAKDPGKIIDFYSKDSSENTVCQVKDRGKKFRELLHKYNLARETSIKGVHHTRISHDFVYGRTSDMYGKEYVSNGEGRFGAVNVTENEYRCIVLPSNSKSDRRGEQVVFVKPELARVLGSHALIVFRAGYTETGRHFIVKISADSTIENDAIAHLDQKVRHAIGVHSGEAVSLFPISSNGFLSSFVENFKNLMPTRYLPVRVSYADLLNAESDVALADPRILSYLGLGNGDILVLEGVVEGRIRRLKLRIAEADARFLEERLRLSKGSVSARFSCPDTVLRVYPDLPPIFIDELTRNLLGVYECPLMPLRVRPSRRQKILFELRELMLVLAISLIGLVSLSDSLIISTASLGFITVVAIVISLARVRSQIGILKRRRP